MQQSALTQLETRPLDEQTANALDLAERVFTLTIANVSRAAFAVNAINPRDGWALNLTPGTPGYRQFVRLKAKADEVAELPAAPDAGEGAE